MTSEAATGSRSEPVRLDSEDVRDIRRNSMWNALQQATILASGSIFGVVLVLVLPLDEFGVYSYAVSLCTIGFAVMTAGLNGLGIKHIVVAGAHGARPVAGILFIREMFCVATFVLLGAISFTSDDRLTTVATLVALSSLFLRALDAPELWYIAHMRSHRTAIIRVVTVGFFAVIRIIAIFALPNLWLFIAIFIAESAVMSLWILWRFHADRDTPGLARPPGSEIRSMTRESSPLALSAIADQVNMRADVVIIQPLMGSTAVGIYTLAARASELAYFLPMVIMNSVLPVLLRALDESRSSGSAARYRHVLQISYNRMFQAGLAVALIVTGICLSPARNLVGAELRPVFDVLAIHIWASPFVFMGAVYSKWIVAEGYLWSSLVRHGAGAVVNVGLNFALIPVLGLNGAALATVVSYTVAGYVACFFGSESRTQGYCMTRAFFSPVPALWTLVRRGPRSGRSGDH